jgi:hypothetical protein
VREIDLDRLTFRLLSGGVAPRHVRRTISELSDHLADLRAEAEAAGCSAEYAAREARRRIGDEEVLVAEVLGRPELRSWAHRFPWAIWGIGPAGVLVAVEALAVITLFVPLALGGEGWIPGRAVRIVYELAVRFLAYGVPLLLAALCARAAARRHSRPLWPIVGIALVAIVGGAVGFGLDWPTSAGARGSFEVSLALAPPFPNAGALALRALGTAAVVIVPLFVRRPWVAPTSL